MLIDMHRLSDLEKVGTIEVYDNGSVRLVEGDQTVRGLVEEYSDGFDTDGTEWDEDGNPCSVPRIAIPSDTMFTSVVNFLSDYYGLCTSELACRLRVKKSA